jgi:hypothetical protein
MVLVPVRQTGALDYVPQDIIVEQEQLQPRPQINYARWDIIAPLAQAPPVLLEKPLPTVAVLDSSTRQISNLIVI